ncbi:PAS domain-containing sensor histidine kinase [Sediminibacterium sp. C3]|uniref:PAS domain-containing sensor histidine kinase n=1 Tax=Sediminibacterium sp. C3 TaxID=1267211 RepID=UPI000427DC31|nr:PAS domain-containing sensor histidine kinase [Sediminibacterium sp. C3]
MESKTQFASIESDILQGIYHALPVATFVWKYQNDDFHLIGFNKAATEFASNQVDQLINKKASELYKSQPQVIADLYHCINDRVSFDREFTYSFKSKEQEKYVYVNYIYVNEDIVTVQAQEISERKKLEQRLMASENRFHSLADYALVGSFIIKDNVFTYINHEFESIFGFTEEHILGKRLTDFILEKDCVLLNQYFAESNRNSKHRSCEVRGIHSNRSIINLEVFGSKKMLNGKEAILGSLLDITEKKKAESRLIEAQSAAKVGSWETDLSNLKVYWSDQTFEIFELNKNEFSLTHETFLNYVHPEDKAKVDKAFKTSFSSADFNTIQHRIITPKGNIKFVEERWKISFNTNNEPIRVFGTCQDITETIEYEEKLALSSLIVNSSHDAILSTTLDGIITSWNKGAENVLGYSDQEAIGKSIYILIPQELQDEEINITKSIKERKVIDRYETVRIKKDGTLLDVSLTVSPIVNEFNQVIGASKIMRDISAQKASEYEKAQIMNDLIQRNKDLEQFAYIVSHNLRAPVANIVGVTNIFKMPDIEPKEKLAMVSALNQSALALDNVIKDLGLILQIRREVNEQKTLIHFSDIIQEIKQSIDYLIKSEKVVFEIDFSEVGQITSVKSYIYSIFYNLISNSIKYRQTHINPIIKIKSSLAENQIVIHFSDNGLGIDLKKNKDTVFGMYKRFHTHIEGKGMGLFMIKTQVETLGGRISIRSEPNKGTEFKIELPAL